MAQPTEGKLLRKVRIRRSTTSSRIGAARTAAAIASASAIAIATDATTRPKLTAA